MAIQSKYQVKAIYIYKGEECEKTEKTLSLEGSMETLSPVRLLGSSWRTQWAETTWDAVLTQRRKGDTKTRWKGNPNWLRIFRPGQKARTRPSSTRGGSHSLSAVVTHNRSKLSLRSPCRITTTFWWWCCCYCCWWWFSWDSEDEGSICCFFRIFF